MTEYAIGFAVSTLMFITACVYWLSKRSRDYTPSEKQQHIVEPKKESQVSNSSESNSEQKLRNVFSVKQKPPVSSNGGANAAGSDRPFESSYYFAHNKHSTGGGYKDGLRAEDYVMNGPKLLSKGGVRVEDEKSNSSVVDDAEERSSASSQSVSEKKQTPQMQASTPITRYLWDDGEGNIAKIHIDTLPVSSTKTINWEGASVSSVEARLIGDNNEGLFIGITYNINDDTSNLTKKCHLHVARMYGNADEVKAMVKKRKLLVKITKKPRQLSNRHSNKGGVWGKLTGGQDGTKTVPVAWPQLSSSSSRLGGSEIDEDMFKKSS
ncbi:hypothetical protein QTG54_001117 [Skeletonema marinoi]|uniref:Uncharacterized protein n=1 Tax=Skeletonema marinoi TaxID=267567 RepID=A0AAD8YNB5_9STRA|nr:hypothetical protein QTG54_001117 [Skeletonema marinoi]